MVHENGEVAAERSFIIKAVVVIWRIIKIPLFLIMLFLRGPIIGVCSLIRGPLFLGWIFAWFVIPERTSLIWFMGGFTFFLFVAEWIYDLILLELSPTPIALIS